jgi:signal transduction histidine kinase
MVADEQAALRRVATLVARGATPEKVFPAVAAEVSVLVGGDLSAIVRFEADGTATTLGDGVRPDNAGKRDTLDPGYIVHTVRETGHSARFDTEDPASANMPPLVRTLRLRSAVASPIVVEGELWGAITAASKDGPLAPGAEQRLTEFTELVATAVANTQARNELTASRARIVAAGDDARRRIERNLHDGTQQRLIALAFDLQRARASVPEDARDTTATLLRAEEDLESILQDLRELSHGLHPPLLSRLGLGPSVQALARRSPIPVHLDVELQGRPPATLETAMYYVVSEAVTNAIKHSHASEIWVVISGDDELRASISDDGVGGADPDSGSGLVGLRDRVDALGGRFALDSPLHGGTKLTIELPTRPAV